MNINQSKWTMFGIITIYTIETLQPNMALDTHTHTHTR